MSVVDFIGSNPIASKSRIGGVFLVIWAKKFCIK